MRGSVCRSSYRRPPPDAAGCAAGARHAGVIYGLIAAMGWGISAIAATNAARRTGTYISVLSGQGIGVLVLVLLAAFLRPPLETLHGPAVAGLVGAGLLGLLGYLTFYRALEYGGALGLVGAVNPAHWGSHTGVARFSLGRHPHLVRRARAPAPL